MICLSSSHNSSKNLSSNEKSCDRPACNFDHWNHHNDFWSDFVRWIVDLKNYTFFVLIRSTPKLYFRLPTFPFAKIMVITLLYRLVEGNHSKNLSLYAQTNFINDVTRKINFDLFVGEDDNVINSFPRSVTAIAQWITRPGQIEYVYGNISSTLSVSFDVSSEINGNNLSESLALLFLGLGIPIVLSSAVELYRDAKMDQ